MSAHGHRPATGIADPPLDDPGAPRCAAEPGAPLPPAAPGTAPAGPQPERRHEHQYQHQRRPEQQKRKKLTGTRRTVVVNAIRVLVLVGFVALWQLLASAGVIDTFYYGQPTGVWSRLQDWVLNGTSQGSLGEQIWVTLQETLMGFGIGTSAGVVCGILLGRLRLLADVFAPFIKTLNSVPRIVFGSVFVIWFGLGVGSKVALSVMLVFFGVFFNAFQGAREVDGNLLANARILGASRIKLTTQVVIPSALSWITASLHIAFGFAVTGAIVGELLGAKAGMGLLIYQSQNNFDPDGVYAGLVITAAVALAAEALITLFERRVLRWQPRARTSGAER